MPLPQQVINQLSREPAVQTPGWSSGILTLTGGIFVMAIVIYLGITFVYEPRLESTMIDLQSQAASLVRSVSQDDQAKLVGFYSQVSNLRGLLRDHILFSQFLAWLETHTEANISYTQFSFASANGNQVTLTGLSRTIPDISQQAAVFEASPLVKSVSISNVMLSTSNAGLYQFTATLIMLPTVFASPLSTAASTAATTTVPTP
jgi:hypothetical protein